MLGILRQVTLPVTLNTPSVGRIIIAPISKVRWRINAVVIAVTSLVCDSSSSLPRLTAVASSYVPASPSSLFSTQQLGSSGQSSVRSCHSFHVGLCKLLLTARTPLVSSEWFSHVQRVGGGESKEEYYFVTHENYMTFKPRV